jgi:hypothetical protein
MTKYVEKLDKEGPVAINARGAQLILGALRNLSRKELPNLTIRKQDKMRDDSLLLHVKNHGNMQFPEKDEFVIQISINSNNGLPVGADISEVEGIYHIAGGGDADFTAQLANDCLNRIEFELAKSALR